MPESLSKKVADDLLGRIRSGEYVAGDRLPSEHALMGQYGVGRNTVREAMQRLRTLGIVEIRPRLGATLLDSGVENALANSAVAVLLHERAVDELYEVRLILEPVAAEKASLHRTETHLLAIRRAITHFRVAHETGTPVWEADIEFHQAIADASGNAMLAKVLAPVADLLGHARQATGTLPAAVEIAVEQHAEIAVAIEARAGKRARRLMATHIEAGIWALNQLREINQTSAPSDEAEQASPQAIPPVTKPPRPRTASQSHRAPSGTEPNRSHPSK